MSENKTPDDEDTISVPLPEQDGVAGVPEGSALDDLTAADREMVDVRAAVEALGRTLDVAMAAFAELRKIVIGDEKSVVHACPPVGSGLTPCCHRSPIDLPLTERISLDGTEVTCQGAPS